MPKFHLSWLCVLSCTYFSITALLILSFVQYALTHAWEAAQCNFLLQPNDCELRSNELSRVLLTSVLTLWSSHQWEQCRTEAGHRERSLTYTRAMSRLNLRKIKCSRSEMNNKRCCGVFAQPALVSDYFSHFHDPKWPHSLSFRISASSNELTSERSYVVLGMRSW